jgi:serine/threonine protein kinase
MVRALQPADPRLIGPYRLVGQLGSGGMGRVFLAMSVGGRPVAVKMIRAELAADPDFRKRFSREVAAARRVNGLFTALVVDADVDATVPWLATAYVQGPSLAETIKDHGPLSAQSVLALAAGLAEGLSAIHSAGVVHGDLKPSNVLLAEDGPRVIDFGISHAAEAAPLTHPGLVMGSPGFMSPEQAMGRKVGPLSDVFSLGTVLAFAATGQRPFGTGSPVELLDRVVHGDPNLDQVPDEIRPLIERCMAKEPDDRPTAALLLAEMGAVQATNEWLPESIVRMMHRDLPLEDRKGTTGSATSAENLGSAAYETPPTPAVSSPAAQTRTAPTADRAPAADQDQALSGGHHAEFQGYLASGEHPQADTQAVRPPGPVSAGRPSGMVPDQAAPVDQLRSDDPPLTSDPQPGAGSEDDGPPPGLWRSLVGACLIVGLLATSGVVGAALVEVARHLTAASSNSQAGPATPTSSGPVNLSPFGLGAGNASSSAPPKITRTYTYQLGSLMYFDIYYTDPGNKATGFGFVGVDGSSLGQKNYSFSSPGNGIIEPNSVSFPFNEGCGTTPSRSTSVRVWITYAAGARSNAMVIHLTCPA